MLSDQPMKLGQILLELFSFFSSRLSIMVVVLLFTIVRYSGPSVNLDFGFPDACLSDFDLVLQQLDVELQCCAPKKVKAHESKCGNQYKKLCEH